MKDNKDVDSLSHTTWRCQYHVVFAPKYRRMVIYGQIKKDIGQILRQLCEQKGIEIIEAEACPDHIHMLISFSPKYSIDVYKRQGVGGGVGHLAGGHRRAPQQQGKDEQRPHPRKVFVFHKLLISSISHCLRKKLRRIGAQAAGQTTHRNAKGVCTVPDYKAMYFELFRASVQAVQLLQDAQTRAEQQLLAADLPPLRLDETEPDDP